MLVYIRAKSRVKTDWPLSFFKLFFMSAATLSTFVTTQYLLYPFCLHERSLFSRLCMHILKIPPMAVSTGDREQAGLFFGAPEFRGALDCLHVVACNPSHTYCGFVHFKNTIQVPVGLDCWPPNLGAQRLMLAVDCITGPGSVLVVWTV